MFRTRCSGRTGAVATPGKPAGAAARRPLLLLGAVAVLGFLGVFFAWPVLAILHRGLSPETVRVLVDPGTWRIVAFTLGQAAASTALALVAGMPLAYLLARVRIPGKVLFRAVITVPFVLPTLVVGMAFRALLGTAEPSASAIVLANAFFNVAVVARTVGGLWSQLDRRAEDAARSLGAGPLRTFGTVTLPALRPALWSAAAVVFLFCSTSFGVVLVLGAGRYRTLETEIYLRTVRMLDLSGAAALSLLQFTAVLAALAVAALARRRRESAGGVRAAERSARKPRGAEWWVVAAGGAVLAALLVPIGALLVRSVSSRSGWSLAGYRALSGTGDGALSVPGWQAALNSLRTATDATWMALSLGVLACLVLISLRKRWTAELMDTALMLPLGVSAVTVGFGYLITLQLLPGDLRTSPLLVPFAQALVVTPLVVRTVLPVLRSVDERLREAAATLGAGPWRVRREVDLPLAGRAICTAAGFGFVVALGEFGATGFLARPESPTLPVAISELISRPGELNTQMAYASCALLMLVTAGAVLVIESLRTDSVGEF